MKWINVKDQLPEYYRQVVVLISLSKSKLKEPQEFQAWIVRGALYACTLRSVDGGIGMVKDGYFKIQDENCILLRSFLEDGVTHWAPMPVFPDEDE